MCSRTYKTWYRWLLGLRYGSAASAWWDCGFESRRGHGYLLWVLYVVT